MKTSFLFTTVLSLFLVHGLCAQQVQYGTNPGKRVVYPDKGQDAATQSADEQTCYGWSNTQTNWDPEKAYNQLKSQYSASMSEIEQSQGGAVRGAAGGALMGLAIGAIAGNAGEGAAIGAVAGGGAGGLRSRRTRKANEEGFEDAADAFQKEFVLWDRHWTACMKGHGYEVE